MTNLCKDLNSLKLNDIYKLKLAKFIYQLHNETLSKSFHNCFIKISAIRNYLNKQNLVYFKPQIKKAIGREIFAHKDFNQRKKLNLPFKPCIVIFKTQLYIKSFIKKQFRLKSKY